MPADDRNETVNNLTALDSFTDPGGTTHTTSVGGGGGGSITLENVNGTAFMTTGTLHAGDNLAWVDDADGTATLNATDTDTVYTDEMAQDAVGTILSADFTYDDVANTINMAPHTGDASAHHAKTLPSEITSANWGDYEIQKDGTDGVGVINFKTV